MTTEPDGTVDTPLTRAAAAAGKGQLLGAVAWSLVSIAQDLSQMRKDLRHWQQQVRRG